MLLRCALAAPLLALLYASPAAAQPRRAPRDTYEAVALYAIGATYGAATGAWIDVQAGLTEPLTAPWLPVVGAGAGVTLAWLVDRPTRIRRGLPTMMGAGLSLGLLAGGSIGIQGWRTGTWGLPTMSTLTWVGTTAGLTFGLAAGLLLNPEPGTGSFVLSGGFWGASLGLLAGYAFDADSAYDVFSVSGEVIGIAATALTAAMLRPTPAQVRWMDLGALTGAVLGGGIGLLLLRDERAAFAGTIQLGLIGGGVAGFLFGASRERVPGGIALRPGVIALPGGFALTVGM
jgi:hypothetical protein